MSSEARVGVDVGGTFTDVILQRRRRPRRRSASCSRRRRATTAAVVEAVGGLADGAPVAEVVHGTTVATNAVLERRGARTALVTTAGFRDVLELRRLRIPHMYDLFWRKPPPLVERQLPLRGERARRRRRHGRPRRSTTDEARARRRRASRATGVESVAVCLLHSLPLPRARAALRRDPARGAAGRDRLALERDPARAAGVRALRDDGRQRVRAAADGALRRPASGPGSTAPGSTAPLTIMQSSGGVMTADDAAARPVFALESGPAAGVVAALGDGASGSAFDERDRVRHGRHDREGVADRGRRASRAAASTRSAARCRPAAA